MAALLSAGLISPAQGSESESPAAFLRRIYAPYVAGETTADPTGKAAPAIFAARLTALIRRDRAQPPGEIGVLDQDPICDCQDFDRLKRLTIKVKALGLHRAKANVRFVIGTEPVGLTYFLTRTVAGWRVSDIAGRDTPSLVRLLEPGILQK